MNYIIEFHLKVGRAKLGINTYVVIGQISLLRLCSQLFNVTC